MQAAIKKYMFKDEKGMAEALAEAQEEFMRLSPARSRVSLLTVWYDPLRKSEPWVPLVHDQDFHRNRETRVRVPAHASRWCSSMGQSTYVLQLHLGIVHSPRCRAAASKSAAVMFACA